MVEHNPILHCSTLSMGMQECNINRLLLTLGVHVLLLIIFPYILLVYYKHYEYVVSM